MSIFYSSILWITRYLLVATFPIPYYFLFSFLFSIGVAVLPVVRSQASQVSQAMEAIQAKPSRVESSQANQRHRMLHLRPAAHSQIHTHTPPVGVVPPPCCCCCCLLEFLVFFQRFPLPTATIRPPAIPMAPTHSPFPSLGSLPCRNFTWIFFFFFFCSFSFSFCRACVCVSVCIFLSVRCFLRCLRLGFEINFNASHSFGFGVSVSAALLNFLVKFCAQSARDAVRGGDALWGCSRGCRSKLGPLGRGSMDPGSGGA